MHHALSSLGPWIDCLCVGQTVPNFAQSMHSPSHLRHLIGDQPDTGCCSATFNLPIQASYCRMRSCLHVCDINDHTQCSVQTDPHKYASLTGPAVLNHALPVSVLMLPQNNIFDCWLLHELSDLETGSCRPIQSPDCARQKSYRTSRNFEQPTKLQQIKMQLPGDHKTARRTPIKSTWHHVQSRQIGFQRNHASTAQLISQG